MASLNPQGSPHDRHSPKPLNATTNFKHAPDSKTSECVRKPSPSSTGQDLTINDVSPIETARERLVQIVVDHFMAQRVVQVMDSEAGEDEQEKPDNGKRKPGVVRYEGDAKFVLPLMYVRNIYETVVNEVDVRLASLDGFRGKTIGVDVDGLFRKLAKKFPEKGPYTFKRTELATPAEITIRFPELVVQEGKGVHFVVVNGLDIVEKPNTLSVADAEWFKRLTGRCEVSISTHEYKFYSSRQIEPVLSKQLASFTDLPNKAEIRISINEDGVGDLKILQQLITQANERCYFQRHRKAAETDVVTDLVFSQPVSLDLLRAFPYVLIIDALHKENRYNIPFLEVLGFTSTGKDFNLACVFINEEKEDNYLWALNQISELCSFVGVTPKTIVTLTDPDQALFNAVEQAFPHTKHLLGRQQIYKSIEDRFLNDTCLNNTATAFEFVNACKTLFESKTEKVYEERLALLEHDWKSKQELIRYMKQTWLSPYKDKIISVWADKVLHFGTHNMTRVKSSRSHKSVKQLLIKPESPDSFDSDFEYLWSELNAIIKGQRTSILMSFDQIKNVPRECKRIDELIKYEVSNKAYEIMADEYKRVKSGGKYPSKCVCQLPVSHGLPCAHQMNKYVTGRTEVPLEAIHQFWQQLDLDVEVPENPSVGARAFLVDLFIMFHEMSMHEKMRCTYAVKKIIESCEEPPASMTTSHSVNFFRKFFTCVWYSEPGFFSSEDDTPLVTPHFQPPFGVSSSEIFGQAYGSMASRSNVEPSHIYDSQKHILRQTKAKNVVDLGNLTILRQFLKEATKHYFFSRHRKEPGTNVVTDLVFAVPDSLAVLRVNPYVLIINATSRENRYKIPFFEVVGISSKAKRFNVACAFIRAEREDNYVWVLNQINELCCFVRETPTTIVTMTGPDQALFNAVKQAFPHTKHVLGRDNIYEHIEDICLKFRCSDIITTRFVTACQKLFESETEKVYETQLASMEDEWKNEPGLIGYLKQMWLMPYKDKIVSAWADKALHFGIHLIDREESALEECLSTFDLSFDHLWMKLIMEIGSQTNAIRFPDDDWMPRRDPYRVKKIDIFKSLEYSVSEKAFEALVHEYNQATRGVNSSECACHLRESYGLPCAHEMAKYVASQTPIPLKAIHKYWRSSSPFEDLWFFPDNPSDRARAFVLDLFIRFREMTISEQLRCECAVNVIMQGVEEPPPPPTSSTKEDQYVDDFLRKWFDAGWIPDFKCSSSDSDTSS